MDTLSRDSSSSSNVLPLVGVIAGALGLILAIVALVKLSTLQKTVAAHDAEIPKIVTIEGDLRAATAKTENDLRGLREGVQNALTQVGTEIGTLRAQITKVEEAQKARPAAAAGPGGKAAAPTGVLNADGTYTIASGDNLSKIARKFNVKLDAIEAENPGLDPRGLKVGQKIRIPRK
jgi:LysM repeat protein